MIWVFAALAFIAGGLVGLSRQINGRLSLSTSAMESAFWNHAVGLLFLSVIAVVFGRLFTPGITEVPGWAYLGGTIGVVFIAASSWLITRIGAAQTAMMIIAGQMVCGTLLDLWLGAAGAPWARMAGVGLILAGLWVSRAPATTED